MTTEKDKDIVYEKVIHETWPCGCMAVECPDCNAVYCDGAQHECPPLSGNWRAPEDPKP